MDIREYVYVLAIIDHGSITHAAQSLYISQPSLSIFIKKLEQRLGFPLFERINSKLLLTHEGKIYEEYARQIVRLSRELDQYFSNLENAQNGMVRIGVTVNKGSVLLQNFVPTIKKNLPNLQVEFVEDVSENLERRVVQRDLDIILLNYPFHTHDLSYIPLYYERVVLSLPASSPHCKAAKPIPGSPYPWLDLSQLQDEPFILSIPGQRLRQIADYLFLTYRIKPNIFMETSSIFTASTFTSTGIGASFLMDTYISAYHLSNTNVAFFSVGETSSTTVPYVIAFPKGCYLSPIAKKCIEQLRQCFPRPLIV